MVGGGDGVYRSNDGGETWQRVLVGSRALCLAVALDAGPRHTWLVGTDTYGILRSEDAGRTWVGANPGLVDLTVLALALSPRFEQDRIGFAGTASGLYRTRNGARAWRAVDTGLDEPAVQCLAISPRFSEDRLVLAGTEADGLLRSDDAGTTWEIVPWLGRRGIAALAFGRPRGGGHPIAAATDEGVAVSHDGGRTWLKRNHGLEGAAVMDVAVSSAYARDQTIYAATTTGLFRSCNRGATWERTPAPTELTRPVCSAPASGSGAPPLFVALTGGCLLASDDAGDTWRTLRHGFDGSEIVSLVLSPSYARDRTLFVGTTTTAAADGSGERVLWRSTDDGARWERWLVEPGSGVLPVALPPTYASDETVFVGLDGRVLKPMRHAREVRAGERRPIWSGTDLGNRTAVVTALAVSPTWASDRTVFAATSAGVFVSRDAGNTFARWSDGLQSLSVVALTVSPNYPTDRLVYAITLGGGIWQRSDVE